MCTFHENKIFLIISEVHQIRTYTNHKKNTNKHTIHQNKTSIIIIDNRKYDIDMRLYKTKI